MNVTLPSLLAATISLPLFAAWAAMVLAIAVGSQLSLLRRYRRFATRADAELRHLERRLDDYQQRVDAEVEQMRAELDAYGVWSDANDRFFHHGLVAVSHMLGARAMPARRACATERRSTQERRATETGWRPVPARNAKPTSSMGPVMRVQRRTCQ